MSIKVSTLVKKGVWREVQEISAATHQSISGLVTEALEEYIRRKRVRPEFIRAVEESLTENKELGHLLAK